MLEKVKCVKCGHMYDINLWQYKRRTYACPMCGCLVHERVVKKGENVMTLIERLEKLQISILDNLKDKEDLSNLNDILNVIKKISIIKQTEKR